MAETNNEQEKVVVEPLGRQLKRIMCKALEGIEVQRLTTLMVDAARQGKSELLIPDLRDAAPNMVMSTSYKEWMRLNEIEYTEVVDQNTAALSVNVKWA